jgi:hypothetical protein
MSVSGELVALSVSVVLRIDINQIRTAMKK